jgi:hypothetical protein
MILAFIAGVLGGVLGGAVLVVFFLLADRMG